MSMHVSDRLLARSDDIMKRWEDRANNEVLSALGLESLTLRDSLPELLKLMAGVLSTTTSRSEARSKWEKEEGIRVGRKHGRERADTLQYTMGQMIFEYHILRQVVCDVLEEHEPLSPVDREVIVCAIEQAVNDAASQFSITVKEANERLAASLTHDLKGPLTVVSIAAQSIMRRADDAAHCRKTAMRALSNIERLDMMIQNLLGVSRIKSGKGLDLRRATFNLDTALHELTEDLTLVYDGRVTTASQVSGDVYWDRMEIFRLIENLTNNAVKFGAVKTPITVEFSEAKDASVVLCVHNQGEPIAPHEHESLFEQFHRGQSPQGHKGWGIGLTVVKGIVEAHGGRIDIERSAERGTNFIATLPRDSRARPGDMPFE